MVKHFAIHFRYLPFAPGTRSFGAKMMSRVSVGRAEASVLQLRVFFDFIWDSSELFLVDNSSR